MENLLVVVDMVNGFVNFGALADKKIDEITPRIEQLIQKAKIKGMKIVAFKDCHTKDDIEFLSFPPHCIKGTGECELIPQLQKYENDMYVIEKPTTNGFDTEEFKGVLSRNTFENIVVCGCCTDICVKNFCYSLKDYLDKNNLPTKIHVYESAVATFDSEVHNAKQIQAETLEEMQQRGIIVKYDKVIEDEKNC